MAACSRPTTSLFPTHTCRGVDRNRHSDTNSGHHQGKAHTGQTFFFIGCRFNDQPLRRYARQIIKRSADTHYAIVDPGRALSQRASRARPYTACDRAPLRG
ncbi:MULTISPECIES: SIR2 family protein [Bradyrhizobium]|uniref:SIR2 family protein n=1 Tax=Bradyrhizobium TaxID=374 RepID=UPI001FCD8C3D|nr:MULTISPECIES: SIR2 family protein [Bradyrhizobium]